MRIHLLFQLQVFELRLVAFHLLRLHVLMRNPYIISHICQCVEQHFRDEDHNGSLGYVME